MLHELPGELEFIKQASAGDADAFGMLVNHYKDALYSFVYRMTHNAADTEDIVQESFLRAFKNLPSFRITLKFSTWLYTIALNVTRNRMKRRSIINFMSLDYFHKDSEDERTVEIADTTTPTPEDSAQQQSEIRQGNIIIQGLPAKYREVFVLRHIEEFSYTDIAEITGLPLGTVETRIHRATKIAVKQYEKKYGVKVK